MRRRQSNPSNTGGKGAKRMKEFGYKAVTIWLDEIEAAAIVKAAEKVGMKVASWVRKLAVESAGGRFQQR